MAVQQPWTIDEAAILLDGYLKFFTGKVTRKQAISDVSEMLRQMALNKGEVIDDVYRNINGITFQMASLESAYRGYTVLKPPTRLFMEMVTIYRTKKAQYDEILRDAQAICSRRTMTMTPKNNCNVSNYESPVVCAHLPLKEREVDEPITDSNTIKRITDFLINRDRYRDNLMFVLMINTGCTVQQLLSLKVGDFLNNGSIDISRLFKVDELIDINSIINAFSRFQNAYNAHSEQFLFVGESNRNKNSVPLDRRSVSRIFNEIGIQLQLPYKLSIRTLRLTYEYYLCSKVKDNIDGNKLLPIKESKALKALYQYFNDNNNLRDKLLFWMGLNLGLGAKDLLSLRFSHFIKNQGIVEYFSLSDIDGLECLPSEDIFYISIPLYIQQEIIEYYTQRNLPSLDSFIFISESNRSSTDHLNRKSADRILKKAANSCGIDYPVSFESLRKTFCYFQIIQNDRPFSALSRVANAIGMYGPSYLLSYLCIGLNEIINTTLQGCDIQQNTPDWVQNIEVNSCMTLDQKQKIEQVLECKFQRGFRLGSGLDIKKFRRFYNSIHDEIIELEDEEIEKTIRACGILHEGKIYLPEIMIPSDTKEKLVGYILNSFAEGKTTIYYEALFNLFSNDFLEYYIYDAYMLKAYLAHINEGNFHIGKSYLSKDICSVSDPYDEVRVYLQNRVTPLDSDELCQILSHIPAVKVKQILGSYGEFVNNGKSAYFYVSIVHFYDDDFDHIREIISNSIKDNGFISGNELFKAIRSLRPHILENNPAISSLGLRDTLKYHLGKEYSFNGNVISDIKQSLTMADVFGEFAKKRGCFTIAELSMLASELETSIYYEAIFEYAFRVSHDDFVSKDDAHFLIEQTDKILDRFCAGSYISLKSINDFGIFPDAGYQWNSFLLEQYVHSFSNAYRLIHVGFNQHACVGAIVKRSAGITNIDDFIVEALANSEIELTKSSALTYLVQEGYLARKNYSGIEQLLIQANAQRNKKGKK